jgi:hypothetical protein
MGLEEVRGKRGEKEDNFEGGYHEYMTDVYIEM